MLMRIWLPILLLFAVSCGADRKSQRASGGGPAGCPAGVSWQYPYAPQLNANVLNFSRQHVGQSVSNGECGELPNVALRSFNAKSFDRTGGPTDANGDYVWGQLVSEVVPGRIPLGVLPGDVIQFRGAHFQWTVGNTTWTSQADHHTAVVESISADRMHLCVLQQNSGGNRTVQYGYYYLGGLTAGLMHYYRPTF